ncbi:MAG TPA: hypothetical protein VHO06_27670 [Polyangia bacterium]|nr:hypothetical protein [Polyangia bacterium]
MVNGASTCLQGTEGAKDVGAICDPSLKSDCKAGLYCQPECGTGRCYKFCDSSDGAACGTGSSCGLTAKDPKSGGLLPFSLCTLVVSCDAVAQNSPSCPAPFACYPATATTTECDCPGSTPVGQTCRLASQCMAGDSCIGTGTSTGVVCLQTCTSSSQCTSGLCNTTPGVTYGYCL